MIRFPTQEVVANCDDLFFVYILYYGNMSGIKKSVMKKHINKEAV